VPAAAALEQRGGKRYPLVEVLADWNNDGDFDHPMSDLSPYVEVATVSRNLAGTVPSEVFLVEGQAAAELSVTLSGHHNGLPMVGVFSQYNGFSPLYGKELEGCPITFRIGIQTAVGAIWYDQFTGTVRNVSPSTEQAEVLLTALDRAEQLRVPVTFPKWAISSYHIDRGWTLAQLCESQWVIDHCLRHGNTSPSPYRWLYDREKGTLSWGEEAEDIGTQFFLSGNGSYAPNVGQLDNARSQGFPQSEGVGKPMFSRSGQYHLDATAPLSRPMAFNGMEDDATGETTDGPWSANESRYWARNRSDFLTESSYYFGFTLDAVDDPDADSNHLYPWSAPQYAPLDIYTGWMQYLRIVINTGSVRAEVRQRETGTGAVTPWYAIPGGSHVEIDVVCDFYPTAKFALFINGVLVSGPSYVDTGWDTWAHWADGPDPFTQPADYVKGLIVVRRKASISDVYWTIRNTSTSDPADAFVKKQMRQAAEYPAVLDRGLNRLTSVPIEKMADAWEVIGAVTGAELGAAFFDETGVFRFWNRETILALQDTIVRTVNLSDIESGLGVTSSLDSVRNVLTADAKWIVASRSVVYTAQSIDELYVPGGGGTAELMVYRNDISQVSPWRIPRFATVTDTNVPNQWDPNGDVEGYVVQFLVAGVWAERNHFTSGVDITCRLDSNGNLVIKAYNGYAEPARFATGTGDNSAALRVLGTLITNNPNVITIARDKASITKHSERNLPLSGDWVQWQPDVVTSLLDFLLPRTVKAIPTTDAITMRGDPRLQLGDTLLGQDPNGLGEELRMQVVGYRRSAGRAVGLVDQLAVELIRPSYIGLWDSEQYGRWGETLIWSA
jgi:hypothetical protein